jgi:hypothetical protein
MLPKESGPSPAGLSVASSPRATGRRLPGEAIRLLPATRHLACRPSEKPFWVTFRVRQRLGFSSANGESTRRAPKRADADQNHRGTGPESSRKWVVPDALPKSGWNATMLGSTRGSRGLIGLQEQHRIPGPSVAAACERQGKVQRGPGPDGRPKSVSPLIWSRSCATKAIVLSPWALPSSDRTQK